MAVAVSEERELLKEKSGVTRRCYVIGCASCLAAVLVAIVIGLVGWALAQFIAAQNTSVKPRRIMLDASSYLEQARVSIDVDVSSGTEAISPSGFSCVLKMPCTKHASGVCQVLEMNAADITRSSKSSAQILLNIPPSVDVSLLQQYLQARVRNIAPPDVQVDCNIVVQLELWKGGPTFHFPHSISQVLGSPEAATTTVIFNQAVEQNSSQNVTSPRSLSFSYDVLDSNYTKPSFKVPDIRSQAKGTLQVRVPAGSFANTVEDWLKDTIVEVKADATCQESSIQAFQSKAVINGLLHSQRSNNGDVTLSLPFALDSQLDFASLIPLMSGVIQGQKTVMWNSNMTGSTYALSDKPSSEHALVLTFAKPESWLAQLFGPEHKVGYHIELPKDAPPERRLSNILQPGGLRALASSVTRGVTSFITSFRFYIDDNDLFGVSFSAIGGDPVHIGADFFLTVMDVTSMTSANTIFNVTLDVYDQQEKVVGDVSFSTTGLGLKLGWAFEIPAQVISLDLAVGNVALTKRFISFNLVGDLDGDTSYNGFANANLQIDGLPTMSFNYTRKDITSTLQKHAMTMMAGPEVRTHSGYDVDLLGYDQSLSAQFASYMQLAGELNVNTGGAVDTYDLAGWAMPSCVYQQGISPQHSNITALKSSNNVMCRGYCLAYDYYNMYRTPAGSYTSPCLQWQYSSCCSGLVSGIASLLSLSMGENKSTSLKTESLIPGFPSISVSTSNVNGELGLQAKIRENGNDLGSGSFRFRSLSNMALTVNVQDSANVTVNAKEIDAATVFTAGMYVSDSFGQLSLQTRDIDRSGDLNALLFRLKAVNNCPFLMGTMNFNVEDSNGVKNIDLNLQNDQSHSELMSSHISIDPQSVGSLDRLAVDGLVKVSGEIIGSASVLANSTGDIVSITPSGSIKLGSSGKVLFGVEVKDNKETKLLATAMQLDTMSTDSASSLATDGTLHLMGDLLGSLHGALMKQGASTMKLSLAISDSSNSEFITVQSNMTTTDGRTAGDVALGLLDSKEWLHTSFSDGFLPVLNNPTFDQFDMDVSLGKQGSGIENVAGDLGWYWQRGPAPLRDTSGVGMKLNGFELQGVKKKPRFSFNTDITAPYEMSIDEKSNTFASSTTSFAIELSLPDVTAFDEAKFVASLARASAVPVEKVSLTSIEYKVKVGYSFSQALSETAAIAAIASAANVPKEKVSVTFARRLDDIFSRELAGTSLVATISSPSKAAVSVIAAKAADVTALQSSLATQGVQVVPVLAAVPTTSVSVVTALQADAGVPAVSVPSASVVSASLTQAFGIPVTASVTNVSMTSAPTTTKRSSFMGSSLASKNGSSYQLLFMAVTVAAVSVSSG
jgi:hypothetical protein